MVAAQIIVVADNQEDLTKRLQDVITQIENGYSTAESRKGNTRVKYIVKETDNGSGMLLPRLPEGVEGTPAEATTTEETAAPAATPSAPVQPALRPLPGDDVDADAEEAGARPVNLPGLNN